ncbi:NAD(P)-binding protein [Streptomyces sp. NPDC001848]|uniref:NAD(P)-binding protein n=1 Tax=Streptomyces sp. NPDC001848 TaxID=3364618 RepID=UPI00369F1291
MQPRNAFETLVIGGSVGGLAAAHEMRAVGAEVAVYERSAGRMEARRAGRRRQRGRRFKAQFG